MKVFIYKVALWVLVTMVCCWIILAIRASIPNKHSLQSHEYNIRQQLDRIPTLSGPKIIVIGGSSNCFGLLSPVLEKHFGMPVSNTGTHAGIGLLMQIRLFEDYIDSGDIALLKPEYSSFYGDTYLGETAFLRIMPTHAPEYIKKMPIRQWAHQIHQLAYYKPTKGEFTDTRSPYHRNSLNQQGDVERFDQRKSSQYEFSPKDTIKGCIQPKAISLIKDFYLRCQNKCATMILLPPPCAESYYNANLSKINMVRLELESAGIPYAAPPYRYKMPDSLCWDTQYHLTQDGAKKCTSLIIKDIERLLQQ